MVRPSPQIANQSLLAATCLIVVAATLIASGRGESIRAQEPAKVASVKPTPTFFSANDCARCHRAGNLAAPLSPEGTTRAALVRLDEYSIWDEQDKHRRSFDALTGPRGRRMSEQLRIDATTERACLTCHSTGFLPGDPDPDVSGALVWKEQGVACIACHGGQKEWILNHGTGEQLIREWRLKPLREKSEVYGMTNLRDPATRTRVCVSCHIGDSEQRRVVTHEMYAAGHPPPSGFETATFEHAMPPHWFGLDEVPLFRADPPQKSRFGFDANELSGTKTVVVGAVVVFQEAMKLLAAQAEFRKRAREPLRDAWPDFTQLDCYACHHELVSPGYLSWRQKRAGEFRFDGTLVVGAAGRPPFRPWPLALLRVALAQAGATTGAAAERASLHHAVDDLFIASTKQPYGEAVDVARAARKLEACSRSLLSALEGSRFDPSVSRKLLLALVDVSAAEFPDFDSAVQISRAFRVIYSECSPPQPNHAQIQEQIARLERMLKLDPYDYRAAAYRLTIAKDLSQDRRRSAFLALSEQDYKASLAKAADYDPNEFKAALDMLATLLGKASAR
jgi:Cytochrome c554 and c-prime